MRLDPVKKQEKFKTQTSFKYFDCFFLLHQPVTKNQKPKTKYIQREEAMLSICFLNCDNNKKQNKENVVFSFWFLVTVWYNTRNMYQKIIALWQIIWWIFFKKSLSLCLFLIAGIFSSIQGLCVDHLIFKLLSNIEIVVELWMFIYILLFA